MRRLLTILAMPFLAGCVVAQVAQTAVAVASVPVKVVSAGVDAATTSQSEADAKRGRELREADGRRARDAAKKAAGEPRSE